MKDNIMSEDIYNTSGT